MAPAHDAAAAAAAEPDSPTAATGAVQLLLRNIDSRTTVIRAQRGDTLDSVLVRLGEAVARRGNLRVVYAGRDLPCGATIGDLGLPPDATLHVTSRLRSTPHADAWSLASRVAAAARFVATCQPPPSAASLEKLVRNFLDTAHAADQKKSPSSLGPVADHMDIFLSSGAPGVLVQLYLSKDEPRRAEAKRAIRCFLRPDPWTGPSIVEAWTAPVLLEFCRSLAAGARNGYPLYADMRGMLATVISDPDWSPARWLDMPRELVAEQVTRFAAETANAVMEEIAGAYRNPGVATKNLAEFKVFWSMLRQQVLEMDAGTPRRPWRTALAETLVSLLGSVDESMARFQMMCLARPPQHKRAAPSSAPPKWTASPHRVLAVLAELDAWSSLDAWPELRRALRCTLAAHKAAVTALVLSAGRESSQSIRWITRHRDLLASEARRHLAMAMLPELVAGGYALPQHEMLIDRSQLLSDSFGYITHATHEELRAGLFVQFKHEKATGPRVLREWFCLVCQELFNPRLVLFSACPHDWRRFFLNPTSVVDPLHLQYLEFSGRMIALDLMYKIQVGVLFDRTLFLQLAGKPITLDDIADADPSLHASCKRILEMDASLVDSDALGLRFVRESEVLGSRTVTELLPGGKDTDVNSENRCKYIDLLIQNTFVNCTRHQLDHFTVGFSTMLGGWNLRGEFFECLDLEDFDQMLGGNKDTIDVKEWRTHTDYRGYSKRDCHINRFWKAVESMTIEQQRGLLFFWTAVKYLPSDGFRGLGSRLLISRAAVSRDHLPTSRTCFYTLSLPAYTSSSMMRSRLQVIVQEHVSSSFGAS